MHAVSCVKISIKVLLLKIKIFLQTPFILGEGGGKKSPRKIVQVCVLH